MLGNFDPKLSWKSLLPGSTPYIEDGHVIPPKNDENPVFSGYTNIQTLRFMIY